MSDPSGCRRTGSLSPPGRGQGEGRARISGRGLDPHPTLSLKGRGVPPHPAVAGLALGLALLAAGVGLADQVTLNDGKQLSNCKVLSETAQEVQVSLSGGATADRTIPSEDIAAILYDDRSLEYKQAELFFKGGNYAKAVEAFKAIGAAAKAGEWAAIYSAYYRAVSLQKWAESDPSKGAEAVQALGDFVTVNKNSRFVYEARLGLAQAYLVQGKFDDARKLADDVVREKGNSAWALSARLLLARVKLRQNDAAGALADFDAALAGLKDKAAPAWAQAAIGKGQALLALGKLEDAEKLLGDLIETTQDSRLRAQAYNALGDGYFKKENFAEARLKYLRVVLLYGPADPAEHAKALYFAAECSRKLNDPKRANDLFKELVETYPGTPWAEKSPIKPAAPPR